MSTHPCATAATLVVLLAGVPVYSAAQETSDVALPRTLDDRPDLQGVWDFRTITPLQRPAALGDKAVLTAEEAEREFTRQLAIKFRSEDG